MYNSRIGDMAAELRIVLWIKYSVMREKSSSRPPPITCRIRNLADRAPHRGPSALQETCHDEVESESLHQTLCDQSVGVQDLRQQAILAAGSQRRCPDRPWFR